MLPTGREHDVLPVRVLTEIFSPRLESWLTLSILTFTLSMLSDYLVLREIISPSKGALIWALVNTRNPNTRRVLPDKETGNELYFYSRVHK
jgi:hypothetical protein